MTTDAPVELTVLLVEDNVADARMVTEMLKDASAPGIVITHAARLRDALRCMQTQGFSAVLLDLSLPDSDGFETFLRLRAGVPRAAA